eukprot:gene22487-23667_t
MWKILIPSRDKDTHGAQIAIRFIMAGQLNPHLLLAVPLAPLAGAAIAGLLGTKFFGNVVGRKVSHTATILGVLIAFVISLQTLLAVTDGASYNGTLYTWMNVAGLKLE